MTKILLLIKIVLFYPALLCAELTWMIPICLVLGAIVLYITIRLTAPHIGEGKYRVVRYVGIVFAAWLGVFPILGFIAEDFRKEWIYFVRNDNCGIKIGMTNGEAKELATSCGQASEISDGYVLRPRGLVKLPISFGVCGLTIKYDGQGHVSQVAGWCD